MTKSKYELEMEKEQNEIKKWIESIVPHLSNPDNWHVNEKWREFGIALDGKNGERLSIYRASNDKNRIVLWGCFPGYEDFLSFKDEKTNITVAQGRTPEAIAKDIERRLLPTYYKVLKRAKKNKTEHDRIVQERAAAMQVLSDALPTNAYIEDGALVAYNFNFFSARWQSYHKNFQLTIEVSLEQAIKIIELLKKEGK